MLTNMQKFTRAVVNSENRMCLHAVVDLLLHIFDQRENNSKTLAPRRFMELIVHVDFSCFV